MDQETKKKLENIRIVLCLTEEEGIAFCVDVVWERLFWFLDHTNKILKEEGS